MEFAADLLARAVARLPFGFENEPFRPSKRLQHMVGYVTGHYGTVEIDEDVNLREGTRHLVSRQMETGLDVWTVCVTITLMDGSEELRQGYIVNGGIAARHLGSNNSS